LSSTFSCGQTFDNLSVPAGANNLGIKISSIQTQTPPDICVVRTTAASVEIKRENVQPQPKVSCYKKAMKSEMKGHRDCNLADNAHRKVPLASCGIRGGGL